MKFLFFIFFSLDKNSIFWVYVNGLQWGSGINTTNGLKTNVNVIIPLPNHGVMNIQLANKPPPGPFYVGIR